MVFQTLMQSMVGFYGFSILFFFVLKGASTLVEDFALPFYILEPISWLAAMRKGVALFASDALGSVLYLFMKTVLSILGYLVASIAASLAMLPAFLVALVAVFLGSFFFSGHTGASMGPAIILGAVLYIAVFAYVFYVQIALNGYVLTLLEAYAIYFVGSRYPALGNLLEPPTTNYIYAPPPTSPPPANEDDGPSLPMNPALI